MEPLEQQFEERLRATLPLCRALGYDPWQFEEMLNDLGGRELAKRLVVSGEFQYGIRRLAQLHRLDLSMEHIMQEAQFAPLFTQQVLEAARWRLAQMESEG